jgi:methionyl-tRNA synthetase
VNDVAHIGHAYTTIIADVLAIYSRLVGYETFFLTGTDEHGQKIEEAAKKREKSTQEYANEISQTFRGLWDDFDITYDKFIRTTDSEHKVGVQQAFAKMYENGDIYKGEYEGHYCISCETFFTDTQLIDDEMCPDCGKITTVVKEESYFFKLSKYEKQLLEWYDSKEDLILPKSRKNEVKRFVEAGLKDLSVTRTSFDWGVKLPKEFDDSKHVMYVWLDALLNYVTALGYGGDEEAMAFWPAKVQLVGKDILRFHAIYWPAFLMSLGLELPKHIAAHGWWTRNGEKMSKSRGNVVNPREVANLYGLENFRYFMLREVPFGQDGDFSQKALIDRINSDLGNDLGNLLNRIIGMSGKYANYAISSVDVAKYHQKELDELDAIFGEVEVLLYEMQLHRYLEQSWRALSLANKAIESYAPWVKVKEGRVDEALALVALVANVLARFSILIHPVMPKTTNTIADALGFEINQATYERFLKQGVLLDDFVIKKVPPLFPRIEEPLMKEKEPVKEESKPKAKEKKKPEPQGVIGIEDFFNVSLKVGEVIEALEVPKSDRLLKLQVDIGEEKPRQIVAGIKEHYRPEELLNKRVCVVANLKPAKLMGILSEGMLLAAKDKKSLALITPDAHIEIGSKIS